MDKSGKAGKRFYQKITDIYATSIDYDPTQPESIGFFQTVQNKLHWAITGQAADYAPLRADIKARVQSARVKAGLAANRAASHRSSV